MDALPWPAITAAGGGWVLTGICVLLLFRGRLVARSTLEDALHDRDQWRTESRIKDQQIVELSEQNHAMLNAFGPTLTDFLASLRRAGVGPANGTESGDET